MFALSINYPCSLNFINNNPYLEIKKLVRQQVLKNQPLVDQDTLSENMDVFLSDFQESFTLDEEKKALFSFGIDISDMAVTSNFF